MGEDHEGAHGRGQLVVGILVRGRVLREILGLGELADVVEVGTDTAKCGIGADLLGARLGKVGEGERVVIGPGSLEAEASEQGMVEIGHLEPRDVGGDPEELLQERQGTTDEHSGEQPGAERDSATKKESTPILEGGDIPTDGTGLPDKDRQQKDGGT